MVESTSGAKGGFVVSGDIRLWCSTRGSGPRVLVVHGGPGLDHHTVAPLAAGLSDVFEVWSPDLPGHGKSMRDDGRTPGLRQLEDKLVNWVGHLDFHFDAIIGHSLGAWLVREMLRHGKLMTSAAVLVSPPAAGQTGPRSALRRAERVTPVTCGDPDSRKELRHHIEAECGGSLPPGVDSIIREANLNHISRYRAIVRNLHRQITTPPRPFASACPVLVIVGDEDRTTPVDQARTVAGAIDEARLLVLEGLGHYPFLQEPAAVAAVIRDFVLECATGDRHPMR